MIACKNGHKTQTVKNGCVRDKQRYTCKRCGDNFVLGDERRPHTTEIKKALCMILYSLGKASFGFLGTLVGVSRTTPDYWIRHAASIIDEPTIETAIQAIECAEMWHVMQSTKEKFGLLTPWIVAQGELWPRCSVVVMRQRSTGATTTSNISQMVSCIQTTGMRLPRSCPRSVISLATHTRMRLNGIIPIHAITSLV